MKSILIKCWLPEYDDLPARILIKNDKVRIAINTNICASHEMTVKDFFANPRYSSFYIFDKASGVDASKILLNSVKCKNCNEIITSYFRHDFRSCKCGKSFVDGGDDYWRYGGDVERVYTIRNMIPGTYFDGNMIVT